jgi:hypothetical protein
MDSLWPGIVLSIIDAGFEVMAPGNAGTGSGAPLKDDVSVEIPRL